jgi:hypothetical protein
MQVTIVNKLGRAMQFTAGPFDIPVKSLIERNCVLPTKIALSQVLINEEEQRIIVGSEANPITVEIKKGIVRKWQGGGGEQYYTLPQARFEALAGAFRQLFPTEFNLIDTGLLPSRI